MDPRPRRAGGIAAILAIIDMRRVGGAVQLVELVEYVLSAVAACVKRLILPPHPEARKQNNNTKKSGEQRCCTFGALDSYPDWADASMDALSGLGHEICPTGSVSSSDSGLSSGIIASSCAY